MRRVALALACLSCATSMGGGSSRPHAAVDAFRLLFEHAIAQRDTAAIARAVAPELVFHERGNTDAIPRSELLGLAAPILQGFPDLQLRVESVIADADSAAARITATGTHQGVWDGIAPTGRRVRFDEMFFCKLRDGRLAECWEVWDKWGLRQQLLSSPP